MLACICQSLLSVRLSLQGTTQSDLSPKPHFVNIMFPMVQADSRAAALLASAFYAVVLAAYHQDRYQQRSLINMVDSW